MPACICLIYHSAAVLFFSGSFEAHSLSHLVWGLPAVCECACVYVVCVCVYVYVFVNGGYTVKTGGVKRSPVRVDDADKRYDGRHCCSEILLKAS